MADPFQKVMRNWNALLREIAAANEPAMREVAQRAFDRSQELVPVQTGKLKQSGFVASERTGSGAKAVVGYAKDGQPDYAIDVHEDLQVAHPTGRSKYLQTAVNETLNSVLEDYARSIKAKTRL